jgi:hypothetical protein
MGHVWIADDYIWDGVYNFDWLKAKITQRKMEIENYIMNPEENIDIRIDLQTIKFNARMNPFFKISTVEKIIEARFMKEYVVYPILDGFNDTMYCRDMKIEMFCGKVLKGYVMERKFIFKRVNYSNGFLDVSIESCIRIGQLKKKICKCYLLEEDLIIVDSEKRILDENLILQRHLEDMGICSNDGGNLIDVQRTKIENEIILNGSVHNFMVVLCNAWNHRTVEY